MKLNDQEKQTLSDAIDKLNEGLDTIIALYNVAEEDQPIIAYEEDVMALIQKAKESYGEEEMAKRINTILKEVFAFLPNEKE